MNVPLTPIRCLYRAVDLYGNKVGVVSGPSSFTYAQFGERCERLAGGLLAEGIRPGDRVGYLSFNNHQLLEGYYGPPLVRAISMPLNVRLQPAELVAALRSAGAAGCNLEDTDHTVGGLRDPDHHAQWLRAVRQAASADGYRLVINARVDVFLGPFLAGAGPGTQEGLVPEAVRRANAYLEAGADCVYPIVLWETDALHRFTSEVRGPVNVARLPQMPSLAQLAAAGVARVSWGPFLYLDAMARFSEQLASLQE